MVKNKGPAGRVVTEGWPSVTDMKWLRVFPEGFIPLGGWSWRAGPLGKSRKLAWRFDKIKSQRYDIEGVPRGASSSRQIDSFNCQSGLANNVSFNRERSEPHCEQRERVPRVYPR